jgi:hypothetical protein
VEKIPYFCGRTAIEESDMNRKESGMEKKKVPLVFLVIGVMGLWLFPPLSMAGPPDNYTANMIMEGMTMPIAKMGNKMRAENPMMQGMVSIHFMDSQKMIMMSTANKTYLEQTLEQERAPSIDDPRVVIEKKQIGSETIDGHPCNKYDAVFYMKDKPAEKYKAIIWEAKDLGGLVIRNETTMPPEKIRGGKGKFVTELKEIKVGAAKSSMFEIPKDYRKVDNMMEMMGGMPKMDEMFKGMKGKK